MSTVPVHSTGYRPSSVNSGVAERWNLHLVRQLLLYLQHDLRNIPRYLLRYTLLVLALYGLLGLWEVHGDGHIPMLLPLRGADPNGHSLRPCAAPQVSDSTRWLGLTPVLAILDEVNPTVATWVRQQHERGTLVFSDRYCGEQQSRGAVSKYDYFQGRLIVYRAMFEESDGNAAAILCHEFRHSRQNPAKVLRYAMSFVLANDGDASIVENDAELYEHEACVAIFGH